MMEPRAIKDGLACGRAQCSCRMNGNVHCPAHDDPTPSLSVSKGKSQDVIMHCHAGCSQEEVIAALTERGLWERPETPYPIAARRTAKPNGADSNMDANTAPLTLDDLARERMIPIERLRDVWGVTATPDGFLIPVDDPDAANFKRYKRHRAGSGPKYFWKPKGVLAKDLVYGLSQCPPEATDLIICAGEPDTWAMIEAGYAAVSFLAGEGGIPNPRAIAKIKKALPNVRRVCVLYDGDDTGRRGGLQVGELMLSTFDEVQVVEAPDGEDAGDLWVRCGADADKLIVVFGALPARQLQRREPRTTVDGDTVNVWLPCEGGAVTFEFADIATARQKFDSIVTVNPDVAGFTSLPFKAHVQLMSVSSGEQFRRAVEATYGKNLIPWPPLINAANQYAMVAYLSASVAVDISTVQAVGEERYRISGLLPEQGTTIVFGQGSSAKTFLVMEMMRCLVYGDPFLGLGVRSGRVLLLDYEGTGPTLARRWRRLLAPHGVDAMPDAFHYLVGRGIAVTDQMQTLRREIARTGATVLVIDSAVSALGGNPLDAEIVGRTMAQLNSLGVTVIIIAHVTKEGGSEYPFGSIFWHNLARMTWFVRRVDDEDSPDIQIGFYNKKANDDRKQKAFGATVRFDDPEGPITVERCDIADVPELAKDMPLQAHILRILERGVMRTIKQLADECEQKDNAVRTACSRLAKKNRVRGVIIPGESEKTWSLLTTRVEESA